MSNPGNSPVRLYLASASAQRLTLLEQLGLRCQTLPMDIDETRLPGESAADYVLRLAISKARTAYSRLDATATVLGADTTVLLNGEIFEKPGNITEARTMLGALSDNTHSVYTGTGIVTQYTETSCVVHTLVSFKALSKNEIDNYIKTGEPMDKAGGYAIQGRAAAFIKHIDGSYSNVMGLPLYETATLLAEVGIDVMRDCVSSLDK